MNQRIKELYNKVFAESMNMRWNIEDAEKFAELIVRECTDVVADAVDHREPASTYVSKIKEHFGVEE